jgi:hypothetical protein
MKMFHIGQKVVCVRDEAEGDLECRYSGGGKSSKIRVGNVYTIREIDTRAVHLHGVASVRLVEVCNPEKMTTVGMWETAYPVACFRPVVEKKTDISVFEEILKRETVDDRAPAHSS